MTVVDGGGLKSTLLEMLWAYFAHVRNVLLCMRLQTTKPRNTSSMSLVLLVQPLRFWFADLWFSGSFFGPVLGLQKCGHEPSHNRLWRFVAALSGVARRTLFWNRVFFSWSWNSAFVLPPHPRESSQPPPRLCIACSKLRTCIGSCIACFALRTWIGSCIACFEL